MIQKLLENRQPDSMHLEIYGRTPVSQLVESRNRSMIDASNYISKHPNFAIEA